MTGCAGVVGSGPTNPKAASRGSLEVTPSSAELGDVAVGSYASQPIRIQATGTVSVTIEKLTIAGSPFSLSGVTLPQTLSPGQSVSVTAEFKPSATGSASGTMSIVSDAADSPLQVPLSGTGVKAVVALAADPSSLAFGTVSDGASLTKQIVLKSTGNTKVEISSAAIAGTEFGVSGNDHGVILDPGQSVDLSVTFHPAASQSGSAAGTLSVSSNAPNSPLHIPLTGSGSGSTTGTHSVDLHWTASSSSTVVGYHVYRGGNAGGPFSKLSAAVDATTSYKDSTVSSGNTYFYVVTSVDSHNVESAFSSVLAVRIP